MSGAAPDSHDQEVVAAIDPGTSKCGVAVVRVDGQVVRRAVAERHDTVAAVVRLVGDAALRAIVVGSGTGSGSIVAELRAASIGAVDLVDERRTSEDARERYWRETPRCGWRRLVPIGMLSPPEPYDDWVAVILAERWLGLTRMAPM